jgi:hypothetical protein
MLTLVCGGHFHRLENQVLHAQYLANASRKASFAGEALEVTAENPWLNYALPLHQLREMGFHD